MTKRGIKKRILQQGKRVLSHLTDPKSTQQKKPKFSLEHVQSNYCITRCGKDDKAAFAVKLRELSQLTWAQIISSPRHGLGCEKIPRESINTSIPKHITPEVQLVAFRFSGLKAMVGYRVGEVFYILWFDRDFSLYPHS